ncbi:MAG: hypothetical protein JO306_09275 [Gemmatimonadetes bacterium]|nr:hypothetical protein [Gemmatimonadota bacterium]
MKMNTTRAGAALLMVMLGLSGCGKEVVVGGEKHVDTSATGDGTPEGSANPSKAPRYALSPGGDPLAAVAGRAQGTIDFTARVSLVASTGQVVPLDGFAMATVRIDGSDTVHLSSANVPAARYTAVRVAFTQVRANVTSGLVIGSTNVTGQLTVVIPAGDSLVVERSVDLGAPSADVRLLVDLDASAWLKAADPVTRLIPAATFRDAVKVRTY